MHQSIESLLQRSALKFIESLIRKIFTENLTQNKEIDSSYRHRFKTSTLNDNDALRTFEAFTGVRKNSTRHISLASKRLLTEKLMDDSREDLSKDDKVARFLRATRNEDKVAKPPVCSNESSDRFSYNGITA